MEMIIIKTLDDRQFPVVLENVRLITIAELKIQIFPEEIQNGLNVKLLFEGRQLRDEEIINTIDFSDQSIIHAIIQSQDQRLNDLQEELQQVQDRIEEIEDELLPRGLM